MRFRSAIVAVFVVTAVGCGAGGSGHGAGPGEVCGMRARDCAAGLFCETAAGQCGASGVCIAQPQLCPQIFAPVCGCDGVTYPNECQANAAGVSVSAQGACEAPAFCGGIAGFPCPGNGVCVDNPNDDCDPANGGADCGGICRCVETVLCVMGAHFDSSPAVCACVPD